MQSMSKFFFGYILSFSVLFAFFSIFLCSLVISYYPFIFLCFDPKGIYENLFGIPGITCAHIDTDFWDDTDKLTDTEQQSLEIPFTLEELKMQFLQC